MQILVFVSFGEKRQFNLNVIFRGRYQHFKASDCISPSLKLKKKKKCNLMMTPAFMLLSPRPLQEGAVPRTYELICRITVQSLPISKPQR